MGNILAKVEATGVSSVQLVNTSGVNYAIYRIHFIAMNNSTGVSAVPTVICSTNLGTSYDAGNNYQYYGFNAWYPEGIQDFDIQSAQNYGIALISDAGIAAHAASCGTMDIYSPGTVGGVTMDTIFCSPQAVAVEASSVGVYTGQMAGWWKGATGTAANAFLISANRQGPSGTTISGLFYLEGVLQR